MKLKSHFKVIYDQQGSTEKDTIDKTKLGPLLELQ